MRIPFQKLNCSCRVRRPRIWDAPEQGDPSHQVKSNSSKRTEHQKKLDGRKNPHAMRNASPRHQPMPTLRDTFWQIHGPCHVLRECQAKQTGRTREEPMRRRACLRVVCKFGRRREGTMTLLAKERKRETENWRHATGLDMVASGGSTGPRMARHGPGIKTHMSMNLHETQWVVPVPASASTWVPAVVIRKASGCTERLDGGSRKLVSCQTSWREQAAGFRHVD